MPTYQRETIYSADDIRAIADHAGSHFFDRETMRFFDSRLLEGVYPCEANRITGESPDTMQANPYAAEVANRFAFVTSERSDWEGRAYTVRILTLASVRDDRPSVSIDTLGGFQHWGTAREARHAAKAWANNNH